MSTTVTDHLETKGNKEEVSHFRRTAVLYLMLVACSIFGIYRIFQSVFPFGLAGEEGCERIWEALGLAKMSKSSGENSGSISSRVSIVWDCGEKVQGPGALLIYACLWICLKSFAIPGGMILSVALGGLVPPIQAQLIATVCEVIGGSMCYILSGLIGGPLLKKLSPQLLEKFQRETNARKTKGDLFYFALFVRMTPLIPNWFVNAASPLAGIPFYIFVSTMAIGIQIATFLSIRTGAMLFALGKNSASGESLLNGQAVQNFLILLVAQFIALIPVYLAPKDVTLTTKAEDEQSPVKSAKTSQRTKSLTGTRKTKPRNSSDRSASPVKRTKKAKTEKSPKASSKVKEN
jgi:uncharacterized membrane protein YdjX (TVP38/TMEM64 family)